MKEKCASPIGLYWPGCLHNCLQAVGYRLFVGAKAYNTTDEYNNNTSVILEHLQRQNRPGSQAPQFFLNSLFFLVTFI